MFAVRSCRLMHGLGVTANPQRAHELFKKASEAGNIDALYNMGLLYMSVRAVGGWGRGGRVSTCRPFEWFFVVAALGDGTAG